jgi:hypothetical protein
MRVGLSRDRKDEEEEVSVEPPYLIRVEEPEIVKDTVQAERIRFFAFTKKMGESISGLMFAISGLMLFISLSYLFDPFLNMYGVPSVKGMLTGESLMVIAGIAGAINILCGFVMMAKE